MAFHDARRKVRPHDEAESGELNIVPYLDILMNLVIFMLLSMAGLATFGMVNVSAAHTGPPSEIGREPPGLVLTVAVARTGFFVATSGVVLESDLAAAGPTIPRTPDGRYDFAALRAKLEEVKAAFPREQKVIVSAERDTDYAALVSTLDATRETADRRLLFPDVTLAQF